MAGDTIHRLRAEALRIPFTVAFRHASAERSETASLYVEAVSRFGLRGHGESCPRSYVTAETVEGARAFAAVHAPSLCEQIVDVASIEAWMSAHAREVDENPAAWCAIELAVLDVLARGAGQSVDGLLSRPSLQGRFQYSAVLGDASASVFRATAERYYHQGFRDFKVKLSGDPERDRDKIAVLRPYAGIRVRADANNLWEDADEALTFLRALDYPLFAVEEPIRPNQYVELARLARALTCKMILDESFLRASQLDELRGATESFVINVRVSKMGGLLRSLRVVEAARAAGLGLIVGAQVGETSLLTRAALTVAAAAGDALVAQEGAFGTYLLARDICEPVLMFGAGGVLDAGGCSSLRDAGWGLDVSLD